MGVAPGAGYDDYPQHNEPDGRTYHYYFRVVRKRIYLILAFALVGIAIAVLSLSSSQKAYLASGRLLFFIPTPAAQKQVGDVDYAGLGHPEYGAYMSTQIELLKSLGLAAEVAKELSDDDKKEFDPSPPGPVGRVLSAAKSLVKRKVETSSPTKPKRGGPDRIAAMIRGRIGALRVGDSRIVEVSFLGRSPARIVRILDAVMETFVQRDMERRYKAASEVLTWLREQQEDSQVAIEKREEELQRYIEGEKLAIAPHSGGEGDTVDAERLSGLSKAITEASAKRMQAEALYQHLLKNTDLQQSSVQVGPSEVLRRLLSDRATLLARKNALAQRFGEKWPEMQEIDASLGGLEQQIQMEREQAVRAAKAEYDVAREQEDRLRKALEEQKEHTIVLKRKGVRYRMLRREIEANEKMFDKLLASAKEANIAEKIDRSQVSIDIKARCVGEVSSKKAKMLAAAIFMFATVVGLGFAFLLEHSNAWIETEDEVEGMLRASLVGSVARLEGEGASRNGRAAPLVARDAPRSLFAEQFRGLSSIAAAKVFAGEHKTLLITSSIPKEGKTLVCANVGYCLAQLGKQVLLIDSDRRRSSLHKVFGVENVSGFVDICRQSEFDIPAVIRPSGVPNLSIMTAGRRQGDTDELSALNSDSLQWLLSVVANRFDAVVVDSAPLGVVADTLDLARLVDTVLLVIRSGKLTKMMAQRSLHQLSSVGANLTGVILNDVHRQAIGQRYYYYYPYRYYDYHDYYDSDGTEQEDASGTDGGKAHADGSGERT